MERALAVQSDGVRLAVREWPGKGPAILLLHGLASSSHIYDLLAPKLTGDFHVVAYDHRGHGQSSKPRSGYGFDRTAGDAAAVIRKLRLRRPLIVGHSWGANVALEVAVRYPRAVSGLVFLDGGFLPMRNRMDWRSARELLAPPPLAGMHVDQFLAMGREMTEGSLRFTQAVQRVFLSLMHVDAEGKIRPRLSRQNHLRILRALWQQDPLELLPRVRVPTLIIATRPKEASGADAMFVEAKRGGEAAVRAIGPRVRFEWMQAIHDVPLQRPEALARRIRRFAAEVA
jgi:pimeloyl-ACP methyl ester carboxylesterase